MRGGGGSEREAETHERNETDLECDEQACCAAHFVIRSDFLHNSSPGRRLWERGGLWVRRVGGGVGVGVIEGHSSSASLLQS